MRRAHIDRPTHRTILEKNRARRTLEEDDAHTVSAREWHLSNVGQAEGRIGADCNVLSAWAHSRGDANVTIAVIDDGFDLTHPGLCGSGKYRDSYDAARDRLDPLPNTIVATHGTACAEVSVGSGNDDTIQGVAPVCSWIPIRVDGRVGDPQELRAFRHALDRGADVITCSWGALDGLNREPWPIPPKLGELIRRCLREGRDGLGIPVFFAAGNGNEPVEFDGYASNADVICVSATTNQDEKAPYSDYGRNVWVSAPSSGGTLGIRATARERLGGAASETGDFGSTSASVAMAAGVAGLMLSVNPKLGVESIRDILRRTAVKANRERPPVSFTDRWGTAYNDGYDQRGHSRVFGWGRLDAGAAVAEAVRMRG